MSARSRLERAMDKSHTICSRRNELKDSFQDSFIVNSTSQHMRLTDSRLVNSPAQVMSLRAYQLLGNHDDDLQLLMRRIHALTYELVPYTQVAQLFVMDVSDSWTGFPAFEKRSLKHGIFGMTLDRCESVHHHNEACIPIVDKHGTIVGIYYVKTKRDVSNEDLNTLHVIAECILNHLTGCLKLEANSKILDQLQVLDKKYKHLQKKYEAAHEEALGFQEQVKELKLVCNKLKATDESRALEYSQNKKTVEKQENLLEESSRVLAAISLLQQFNHKFQQDDVQKLFQILIPDSEIQMYYFDIEKGLLWAPFLNSLQLRVEKRYMCGSHAAHESYHNRKVNISKDQKEIFIPLSTLNDDTMTIILSSTTSLSNDLKIVEHFLSQHFNPTLQRLKSLHHYEQVFGFLKKHKTKPGSSFEELFNSLFDSKLAFDVNLQDRRIHALQENRVKFIHPFTAVEQSIFEILSPVLFSLFQPAQFSKNQIIPVSIESKGDGDALSISKFEYSFDNQKFLDLEKQFENLEKQRAFETSAILDTLRNLGEFTDVQQLMKFQCPQYLRNELFATIQESRRCALTAVLEARQTEMSTFENLTREKNAAHQMCRAARNACRTAEEDVEEAERTIQNLSFEIAGLKIQICNSVSKIDHLESENQFHTNLVTVLKLESKKQKMELSEFEVESTKEKEKLQSNVFALDKKCKRIKAEMCQEIESIERDWSKRQVELKNSYESKICNLDEKYEILEHDYDDSMEKLSAKNKEASRAVREVEVELMKAKADLISAKNELLLRHSYHHSPILVDIDSII